jgi:FkbM family methyltransferase
MARRTARHRFVRRHVLPRFPERTGTISGGAGAGLRFRAPAGSPGYLLGAAEPLVQEALVRHLAPGDVVYDVGAHVGFMTLIAARLVGRTGRVIAFEPDAANRSALLENVALNGFQNIDVLEVAASAQSGSASLVGGGLTGSLGDGDQVRLSRLDELELPRPALVKIDVEGHETEVLRGATGLLKRHPIIVCEIHGATRASCEDVLRPFGYEFDWLDDGGMPHLLARPAENSVQG